MRRYRACAATAMVLALVGVAGTASAGEPSPFEHFVSARDGRLFDGERELRFISFNTPTLNYVEDEFAFETLHPYRLPDTFEIRDTLETVRQMGGQVVRLYTFPVRRQQDPADVPTYVLAPGHLDETSMQAMDLVLAVANEVGPVPVTHHTFVDAMRGKASPYASTGDVKRVTGDARRFRERLHRRRASNGATLLYALPGPITGVRIQAFAESGDDPLVVLGSPDGRTFGPLSVERQSFVLGDEDYGYWRPILYSGPGREDDRFLKIVFRTPAQLSRVEIESIPSP